MLFLLKFFKIGKAKRQWNYSVGHYNAITNFFQAIDYSTTSWMILTVNCGPCHVLTVTNVPFWARCGGTWLWSQLSGTLRQENLYHRQIRLNKTVSISVKKIKKGQRHTCPWYGTEAYCGVNALGSIPRTQEEEIKRKSSSLLGCAENGGGYAHLGARGTQKPAPLLNFAVNLKTALLTGLEKNSSKGPT